MLPPDRHEFACRLFCRILHRLEERDQKNEQQQENSPTSQYSQTSRAVLEKCATHKPSMSSVPKSFNPRTKEKHISRDAAG